MSAIGDQASEIVRGLLSLEINTVVKANMTCLPMDSVEQGLCDVAVDYADWLKRQGALSKEYEVSKDLSGGLLQSYDRIAKEAEAFHGAGDHAARDTLMASRIARNARTILGLWNRLTAAAPKADDVVRLRKIWEMGAEEVVLQTVVWIDGDVTQRVRADTADYDMQVLAAVHHAGVGTATSIWKELAGLVVSLFESLWSKQKLPK